MNVRRRMQAGLADADEAIGQAAGMDMCHQ